MRRLSEHGIKVNAKKCSFFQQLVTNLGQEIDKDDLPPKAEHVEAIRKAPGATSVSQSEDLFWV